MTMTTLRLKALIAGVLCAAATAYGSPKQVAKGVWLEDFEDGSLAGWESKSVRPMDIGRSEEGAFLALRGTMSLKDKPFKNGVVELRIRGVRGGEAKADGGILLDGKCEARYVQRGRVLLSKIGKPRKSVREMKRSRDLTAWKTLKLVCAGDVVTAYVDGQFACQLTGVGPVAEKVTIKAKSRPHVDFVRITDHVRPEDHLVFEPVSDDDCLVFAPGKPIPLRMKVANHYASAQTVAVGVKIRKWTPQNIAEPSPVTVTVPAGGEVEKVFPVGALEEGYYQVVVEPTGMSFPIAVQEKADVAAAKRPEIWPGLEGGDLQFGAYWYFQHWSLPKLWANTYCHAAGRLLQKHGFNTYVRMGGLPHDHMDILAAYGVYCHSRGDRGVNYKFIAGTYIGDEPRHKDIPKYKEMYQKARNSFKDPTCTIGSCMIGDGGVKKMAHAWDELLPIGHLRLFRWYGIKAEHYGVLNPYKRRPSFVETLRDARDGYRQDGYPVWVILPSLGSRGPESFYGLPSPTQYRSMMHIAAAYAAKGMVFWTLHDHTFYSQGLVGPETLQPNDGRMAEAGRMAHLLQPNRKLLASLKEADRSLFCDHPAVEAVQSVSTLDGRPYVYLVNKHPVESAEFTLYGVKTGAKVSDVYTGKTFSSKPGTARLLDGSPKKLGAIAMTLEPGAGMLLRCAKAAVASRALPGADWEAAGKQAIERALDRYAETIGELDEADDSALRSSDHTVKILVRDDKAKGARYYCLVNRNPLAATDFTLFGFKPEHIAQNTETGQRVKVAPETRTGFNGSRFETLSARFSLAPGASLLLRLDKEMVTTERVEFPAWVEKASEPNLVYLYDTEHISRIAPGWSKRGKSLEEQGGTVKLFSALNDTGVAYEKSLYAHADYRIDYAIPDGFTHFASAAGFGGTAKRGDVVFQVWVDEEKKYDSGMVRCGDPVIPVVVDIAGGKQITLVTLVADHNIQNDYVFWGAARLVRK